MSDVVMPEDVEIVLLVAEGDDLDISIEWRSAAPTSIDFDFVTFDWAAADDCVVLDTKLMGTSVGRNTAFRRVCCGVANGENKSG